MKVLIVQTGAMFARDEADYYADDLCKALEQHGHAVDTTMIPFSGAIADIVSQTMAYRLFDLRDRGDVCIAMGPFSWAVQHHNKRAWVFSRSSPLYNHWETSFGAVAGSPTYRIVRDYVHSFDRQCLQESARVFAASGRVAAALRADDVRASTLRPPPAARLCPVADDIAAGDYLLAAGPIVDEARLPLLVAAFGMTTSPRARLVICGNAARLEELEYLQQLIAGCPRSSAIALEAEADDAMVRSRIAACVGLVAIPLRDDSPGPITLAAGSIGKPLLTTRDSGELADLVAAAGGGDVVEPAPAALAAAIDVMFDDSRSAVRTGEQLAAHLRNTLPSWAGVVSQLLR